MKPLFVINDLHIGAIRSGGTTPATALKLRQDLLFGYQQLLEMVDGSDLLINGDLFDTANVPLTDMFTALQLTDSWLRKNPMSVLTLPPGNHDLSKNREMFSSFDFFVQMLCLEFPNRILVPREARHLPSLVVPIIDAWVVPHMPNQDLFDLELKKVPPCDYLFLHCNYDNKFALQSDHSLNLSPEMATALPAKRIIIGHEHQHKAALDGKVLIIGNQMPSSVADCLGNDTKFALQISGSDYKWLETWYADDNFLQVDWRELDAQSVDFVRVIGDATAAEAAAVVAAISKFRQKTNALVVTNAVQIEGVSTSEMEITLEQVQSFNVMSELLDYLNEKEREVVSRLLEEHGGRA